jgi:hypothetical protein
MQQQGAAARQRGVDQRWRVARRDDPAIVTQWHWAAAGEVGVRSHAAGTRLAVLVDQMAGSAVH